MSAANPAPPVQSGASVDASSCTVLASILQDIGALEYLPKFTDKLLDDQWIVRLSSKGKLKPSVLVEIGLPEDKCALFVEKCREGLGVQSAGNPSSSDATEGRLPTRLPPLQLARDTSLSSEHPDVTSSASDSSVASALLTRSNPSSTHPAGDASPESRLSGTSTVPPANSATPADAKAVLRALNFEVFEKLGKGGFGTVFRCKDRVQKRNTAVKLVNDPKNAEDARREGQRMLRVNHRNIVRMYNIHDISDGTCALEMEFVPGGDLSKHLEACRLPHEAVLRFSQQLLEALDYLHTNMEDANGKVILLHGDIKPQNILLQCNVPAVGSPVDYGSAEIKLADFGLAKILDQQALTESFKLSVAVTKALDMKGTQNYMPPEALKQSREYKRSVSDDLWSACLVILEMDTGLTLEQLMHAPGSVKIDELLTRATKELLPLLCSVLAVPDPASRCPSAAELLQKLKASKDPLFIWQRYDETAETFVPVHPASSVALEKAFSAYQPGTTLPLEAPLDLQYDIKDLLVSLAEKKVLALGKQTHQKSSGNECRIRRIIKPSALTSKDSIPVWQELVDGKEWLQCSPSMCAKLDIDAQNPHARIGAARYRRMTIQSDCIDTVQLPHALTSEPYLAPAQPVDIAMLNLRVHDSLPEWDVTEMSQVVNPALASKYAAYRRRVAASCNGDPNERMLFHLASDFVIPKIWQAGEGFETRLAQWAEVGKGSYFCEHLIYNYAYKYGLWAPPDKMKDVPESQIKIGEKMRVFVVLVSLGNVADMGPGCESCPSPAFRDWKKEYDYQKSDKNPNPLPTRPPAGPLSSDPALRQHILDLHQVKADPRHDSVMSTEGDFATHPDSTCKTPTGLHVRHILHPRLQARAKEWGKQYVLFDTASAYPMFLLTLTKTRESPMKLQQLTDSGCDVARIKGLGFTAGDVKALGKTVQEMLLTGWSVLDLKAAGFDAKSLLTGGCSASELTSVGFTASEVRDAGASLTDSEVSQVRVTLQMCSGARRLLSLFSVCRLLQLAVLT